MGSSTPIRSKSCGPQSSGTGKAAFCSPARRGFVQRVLIVDSHPITRHGLRRVLDKEMDLSVCGEVRDAAEARLVIRDLKPDVVIIDFDVKDDNVTEFVRDVRARYPKLPVLVFSIQEDTLYAERMLAAGARGYVMKDVSCEQLLLSLRHVLDGQVYLSRDYSNQLINRIASLGPQVTADPFNLLSKREIQVLQKIGAGASTREAASEFNVSVKTIESHRQRIKRKLNLRTITQLIQYAHSRLEARITPPL